MATVTWIGKAQARPQIDRITITSNTTNQTFGATINGKTFTYQVVAGDTTSDIASAVASVLSSAPEGEFEELSFVQGNTTYGGNNTVHVTGPDDGATFTLTTAGNGTIAATTIVAAISPSDIGNGINYSTGSLPSAGDTLVLENSAVGLKYNGTALATIPLTWDIRDTFTGDLGLPELNPAGYVEYRQKLLQANGSTFRFSVGTDAGTWRVQIANATASSVTISGSVATGTAAGEETIELANLPANSVIAMSGGSLAIAPLASQAANATTVTASDATVRVGSGATLGTLTIRGTTLDTRAGYSVLTMDGTAEVTVLGSAAGLNHFVQEGTLTWKSSGTFGNATIGSGGTLDLTNAPASVAAGTVVLESGSSLLDPRNRITRPWSYARSGCRSDEVTVVTGAGGNVTEGS